MTKTVDGRESISLKIKGIGALLMHSTAGMDPFNPDAQAMARELTRPPKEKKLLENIIARQKLEWKMGFYLDAANIPAIPSTMILACVRDGAKAYKLGTEVKRSVDVDAGEYIALTYPGPKDLSAMWENPQFRHTVPAVVGQSKVMRTRPRFENWSLTFTLLFEAEYMQRDQLIEIVQLAGRRVGMGDFRPRFGRYDLVSIDGKDA